MTESIQKIDYSSINKIIDKVASIMFKALPVPIFKIHSIIKSAKVFGIVAFLILLIGSILTSKAAIEYRNKTNLVITEYDDGEVIKTSSRIIDGKPDGKCSVIKDEITGNKKIKKCNKKVKIWIKYLIYTVIGFLLPLYFIMPVANLMHFRKKYFANPYHNLSVDYLLRFFYPLKWGEIWNNQKYDDLRKNTYLKAMYGNKND
tara:strand:- start:116 stop:724 length:609 start_codon:yes stop_codon:yes gene_type:complete